VIPAACITEWSQQCPWIPAALRPRNSLIEILAQSLHYLGAQAKSRLSQSEKSIFKIDQASRCGIRQETRRAGDPQTECARNFATAFFIEDQQAGIIADDDHGTACRNSNEVRVSAKISSAECPGHPPCFDSTACASQRDSSSSILRTCSSDNTSLAYASTAKASRAARPRFWNPAPSSAAKSSGMFTVRVIAPEVIPTGTTPQIRKLPDKFSLLAPAFPPNTR
jgi:hypothetical protein